MGSEVNNNGGGGSSGNSSIEVSSWLKGLAVAPEYHPTLAEFQDPIAYIFKIEKEASRYGICKIVPPVSSAPRKTVVSNLNRSLSARAGAGSNGGAPTFTTRQQQIGFCPRKHHRPVQKPVWQSGENFTVQEFEAKAKGFEKAYLKKFVKKPLNALEIETLFWKATLDKPFSVEYANDMPGSAFSVKKDRVGGEGTNNNSANNCNETVGETEWNMRGVSRAKGSLLRFMKEEIPGVTSPMVYIAMMFSWFAWHVEDHDLHSLNYLHMGAGKTWYGVPREAAVAFEDVIRAHGYGGEINPLVTFATLGEKTTVMSPEVLVNAGVPCCRLVQNPGEFVVTFPRAYHSGFSHGFNCGEAANIATPEWLMVAKDAAIRRASINCPPMVSHFQLLYDLALSLHSRVPKNIGMEPRSSRLKDKKKDEGEILVKNLFVQDVLQNNNLLHILGKGSSVVILPRISLSKSICSNLQGGFLSKVKARLFSSFCSPDLEVKTRKSLVSEDIMVDRIQGSKHVTGPHASTVNTGSDGDQCDRVTSQGLFSCITCGILCFASVAMIQPTETASQYLISGDCSIFSDWEGNADSVAVFSEYTAAPESFASAGLMLKRSRSAPFDIPIGSAGQIQSLDDDTAVVMSNTEARKDTTSLGLLALNYGNSSDSEDDICEADIPIEACETKSRSSSRENPYDLDNSGSASHGTSNCDVPPCIKDNRADKICFEIDDSYSERLLTKAKFKDKSEGSFDYSRPNLGLQNVASNFSSVVNNAETIISTTSVVTESGKKPSAPRSDEDSSRMHIFCLQHAIQVEKQLQSIGGAHVVLLCHPDYPELEAQAKEVAEELGSDHLWSDISYREATKEDEEMIQLTLDGEEAIHGNGDWAVKLGINLYYSANLSRSPLYSKQMPYNHVIYNAFGCRSTADNENNSQSNGKSSGRHKKLVVAGKWCGKVWMSNQVHPLLAERESEEQEQERSISAPFKADSKFQRPLEDNKTAEAASTTCKMVRKRKASAESRSAIKAESLEEEDSEADFEALPISGKQHKNNLRNKRMKKETPEPQMKSVRRGKQLEAEDPVDDFEVLAIFGKRQKDNLRNKRMKKETPETQLKRERNCKQLEVEDSEDDFVVQPISVKQHKNNVTYKLKKKETPGPQMKSVRNGKQLEGGDSEDDFELLPISGKQHKSILRNKQRKKNTPEPQLKGARNGKQLEAEDSEEDFEVHLISGKHQNNNLRNKRMKKETPEPQLKSARNGRQLESRDEDELEGGPSTRLRKRTAKPSKDSVKKVEVKLSSKKQNKSTKAKKGPAVKAAVRSNGTKIKEEAEFQCDMEGCSMSFGSKHELVLHKKNICPVKGCGKKFFSHKYLVQHRRVHLDDRPLKCPWKGCKMTFKWAWARTEHIRVHTGERPYVCTEPGCGQTFRFVSDFSRHKRKTGHISKKVKR